LKEIIPKFSRVMVLWDPQDRGSMQQWKESQMAAKELGLQIHSIEVSSANDLESAFKEATKAGNTALAVTPKPIIGSKTDCRPGVKKSASRDIRLAKLCRQRGVDVLWSRPHRTLQARGIDG
jgi:ABC transporter substrate binding protein